MPTRASYHGEWRRAAATGAKLALAHHPLCRYFHADHFTVAGVRVCRGCAVTWPLFAIAFPLALLAIRFTLATAVGALAAGAVLGAPQFTTYVRRWPGPVRVAVKALGGVGLGVFLAGVLLWPAALGWRVAALAALWLGFLVLQAVRMRSILRTCDACPWHRRWDACPGFHPGAPDAPFAVGQP